MNMKRISTMLIVLLLLIVPVQVFAASPYTEKPILNLPPLDPTAPRIVDEANLYSDATEAELLEKIGGIRDTYQSDVVLVTVPALPDERNVEEFTDDYFDYNGYGITEDRNGVMLLIAMESRDVHITTTGSGIRAVTDYGVDYLFDEILPDLRDGNYDRMALTFVDKVETLLKQAAKGQAYDVSNPVRPTLLESLTFAFLATPVGAAVGGVLGFGAMKAASGAHRNAVKQSFATNYFTPGAALWAVNNDNMIDQQITRRKVAAATAVRSSSGGSGGSSTHRSSSGQSHGGGSRKF